MFKVCCSDHRPILLSCRLAFHKTGNPVHSGEWSENKTLKKKKKKTVCEKKTLVQEFVLTKIIDLKWLANLHNLYQYYHTIRLENDYDGDRRVMDSGKSSESGNCWIDVWRTSIPMYTFEEFMKM